MTYFKLRHYRTLGSAFSYEWGDVAAVAAAGPADLLVTPRDGQQQRLSFAGLHDGPAPRDRLLAHAQAALAPPAGENRPV